MERRVLNAHCHNPLGFHNRNIFSSRCSMSSFYNPSKLMQPLPPKYPAVASSSSSATVGGGGVNYIEHSVNKFDTLAGLAIKYGVEVADIKKLNGLVTDHQMFARKTLYIPLDGRLPPISDAPDNQGPNSSEQTPSKQSKPVAFDSFKLGGSSALLSVAPVMTAQQGYYGLEPALEKTHSEGLEMGLYLQREAQYPEDGTSVPLSHHRKSKSVAYDLYAKNMAHNVEAKAPEMILKEEVISGGGFSALGGKGSKGLALRTKSVSRTVSGVDNEGGFPIALGNVSQAKIPSGVRRTCSTPSLQDAENGTSSSSSWWNLKPDLQALSTSSVTKPILDGLAIPISVKKSKAALD